MRQISYGITAFIVLVFAVAMMLTVWGRSARSSEAEQGLSEAMRLAMETLLTQRSYDIEEKEEFIADFLEALLIQMDSESDITVHILRADQKKGLLSVEVIEEYRHPNGAIGRVSACRTVILDRTCG